MKKFLMIISSAVVSVFLFWLGVITISHQSSAAFELGIMLCFASLVHWIFWPWNLCSTKSKENNP